MNAVLDGFSKAAGFKRTALKHVVRARQGWESVTGYRSPKHYLADMALDWATVARSGSDSDPLRSLFRLNAHYLKELKARP